MRLPLAAVAVLLAFLVGCSGEKTQRKEVKLEGVTTHKKKERPWTTAQAKKTEKAPEKKAVPVNLSAAEQAIKQLNENRVRIGLRPLTLHPILMRAAQDYAVLLAKEKNINAVPGGKNLGQRIQDAGYAASNLGSQQTSTRDTPTVDTIGGYLKQLAPNLANAVDVGVGIASGDDGNHYIVIVHGTPLVKM